MELRPDASLWPVLLVAATALHAGFQLSVTVLVYPALAEVPADRFEHAHAVHSRRIVPLVGLVYGAVAVTGLGALLTTPGSWWVWVAVGASTVAVLVTATRAAPLHGRLGRQGPAPTLVAALVRADRVRTVAALVALAAAVAQAGGF